VRERERERENDRVRGENERVRKRGGDSERERTHGRFPDESCKNHMLALPRSEGGRKLSQTMEYDQLPAVLLAYEVAA